MGIKAIKSVENSLQPDPVFDLQNMVKVRHEPVTNYYTFEKKIGAGTYGEVFMAIHEATGHVRAIKKISILKFARAKAMIMNEISLLKCLVAVVKHRIIRASSRSTRFSSRGSSST